jgi:hypothetical protein
MFLLLGSTFSRYGDDGIPLVHEFVTAEEVETKYTLEHEDVLFSRSGATAGKTFIYTKDIGPSIFAGYCIRFRFDRDKVRPWFVYFYSKTNRYKAWVQSMQRPAGQLNINKEEFKSFAIPVIDTGEQDKLIKALSKRRMERDAKLAEADALLSGIDEFVLGELGLPKPKEDGRMVFAVRLGQLLGNRLDPPAYRPFFEKGKPFKTPTKPLGAVAMIDENPKTPLNDTDSLVPYVGLPECEDTRVREIDMRQYSEVRGRSVAFPGDILFARIEPSVFNKKYVLAHCCPKQSNLM